MSTARKGLGMLVVAAGAGALAMSCTNASNVLQGTTAHQPPPGPAVSQRIVINSPALGRRLQYGEAITRRVGLLLHAQVTLENVSKRPVAFEYRWEWTDAQGFQLGDTLSTWQPGFIGGGEHKLMTGVGPGPGAANFRLYLRRSGG